MGIPPGSSTGKNDPEDAHLWQNSTINIQFGPLQAPAPALRASFIDPQIQGCRFSQRSSANAMKKPKRSPLFNEKKAAEVAAFFLLKAANRNASMTVLKLMKLMYLAERESYRLYGDPIIGDALVSMPNGPVLSASLNLINATPDERDDGSYWDKLIAEREDRYMALRPDTGVTSTEDLMELSQADAEILETIWARFGTKSALQLRDYTHDPKNCPEWEDPDGSSIPIETETLLRGLGFSDTQIEATVANIEQRAWAAGNFALLKAPA